MFPETRTHCAVAATAFSAYPLCPDRSCFFKPFKYTQVAYTVLMILVFLETPLFTRLLPCYLNDESYRALQRALLENPEPGDVMPGTGGFRKVRREDSRRG